MSTIFQKLLLLTPARVGSLRPNSEIARLTARICREAAVTSDLSPKQREIALLLAHGKRQREIAWRTGLAIETNSAAFYQSGGAQRTPEGFARRPASHNRALI